MYLIIERAQVNLSAAELGAVELVTDSGHPLVTCKK